ncbi:MAG: SdrD B-like domain-containing protein [Acidobacteriota bacterium]
MLTLPHGSTRPTTPLPAFPFSLGLVIFLGPMILLGLTLAAIPAAAATADAVPGCAPGVDRFDDGALGPWTLTDLGDAAAGLAAEVDGRLHLTGTGSSLYQGSDHGAFLFQPMEGDFRATVAVLGAPVDDGGPYRKGALMTRASQDPDAPRVMVTWVPHFPDPRLGEVPALMFDARDADGNTFALASTVPNVQPPVRVAIQRLGDRFSVFYSAAGSPWVQPRGGAGGSVEIPMGPDALTGVAVASYDPERPMTVAFDDLTLCQPADRAPTLTRLPCSPDAALDIVYLVDHSDSMARPHGADTQGAPRVSKLDAARDALLAIHDGLALRGTDVRTALVTFTGSRDPEDNLDFGASVEADLLAGADAVGASLRSLRLPVLDPYRPNTTTPAAIGLAKVLDLLAEQGSPERPAVVIWATDGMPNVDALGIGPAAYPEDAVAAIRLVDSEGAFLSADRVSWIGDFDTAAGVFGGQVLADTMAAIETLRSSLSDVRIFGLVPRGDGAEAPAFHGDLMDYAAHIAQGDVVSAATHGALVDSAPELLTSITCGQPGPGAVEGRVWLDEDGDGRDDGGEPGIAGVTVHLDVGPETFTALSAGDGSFGFVGVEPGPALVRVAAASLPAYVGAVTRGNPAVDVAPWRAAEVGFGFAPADDGGIPAGGCLEDDFEDGDLDGAWRTTFLGDAFLGGAETPGGVLRLTGDGSSLYAGPDDGVFLNRRVPGDFFAEVEVLGFSGDGGAYAKAGVMVRASNADDAARLIVQVVPDFGGTGERVLQFRYRAYDGAAGDGTWAGNLPIDPAASLRLAIGRQSHTYTAYYSLDGGPWQIPRGGMGGGVILNLGTDPLVGLNAVSYAPGTPFGADFDHLAVCR